LNDQIIQKINKFNIFNVEDPKKESEQYYLMIIKKRHTDSMFGYANKLSESLYCKDLKKNQSEKYFKMAIEKRSSDAIFIHANILSEDFYDKCRKKDWEEYYLKAINKVYIKALYHYAKKLSEGLYGENKKPLSSQYMKI
jgi:TPR repeat protein